MSSDEPRMAASPRSAPPEDGAEKPSPLRVTAPDGQGGPDAATKACATPFSVPSQGARGARERKLGRTFGGAERARFWGSVLTDQALAAGACGR